MALPATDDFNRADGPLSDGPNWTDSYNTGVRIRILNNQVTGADSSTTVRCCHWSGDVFDSEHYSQLEFIFQTQNGGGPGVRCGVNQSYVVYNGTSQNSIFVLRHDGTSSATLGTYVGGSMAANSDYKITAEDESSQTRIKVYEDDNLLTGLDMLDGDFGGGAAGIFTQRDSLAFDNFIGDNLAAGPAPGSSIPVISRFYRSLLAGGNR